MTQQGKLSPEDEEQLLNARAEARRTTAAYRDLVVEMIEKSSYREVERITGVSTNTLQRWKRAGSAGDLAARERVRQMRSPR